MTGPVVDGIVHVTETLPPASVTPLGCETVPADGANETVMPGTGRPPVPETWKTMELSSVELALPNCPSPEATTIAVGSGRTVTNTVSGGTSVRSAATMPTVPGVEPATANPVPLPTVAIVVSSDVHPTGAGVTDPPGSRASPTICNASVEKSVFCGKDRERRRVGSGPYVVDDDGRGHCAGRRTNRSQDGVGPCLEQHGSTGTCDVHGYHEERRLLEHDDGEGEIDGVTIDGDSRVGDDRRVCKAQQHHTRGIDFDHARKRT